MEESAGRASLGEEDKKIGGQRTLRESKLFEKFHLFFFVFLKISQ